MKLDGYGERLLLDNADTIRTFLSSLASRIGMTVINGPTIVSFKDLSGDPAAGLTGLVMIAESHIAIHTWPEFSYFRLDVSSCARFDASTVRAFTADCLRVTKVVRDKLDMDRGGPPDLDIRTTSPSEYERQAIG